MKNLVKKHRPALRVTELAPGAAVASLSTDVLRTVAGGTVGYGGTYDHRRKICITDTWEY